MPTKRGRPSSDPPLVRLDGLLHIMDKLEDSKRRKCIVCNSKGKGQKLCIFVRPVFRIPPYTLHHVLGYIKPKKIIEYCALFDVIWWYFLTLYFLCCIWSYWELYYTCSVVPVLRIYLPLILLWYWYMLLNITMLIISYYCDKCQLKFTNIHNVILSLCSLCLSFHSTQ